MASIGRTSCPFCGCNAASLEAATSGSLSVCQCPNCSRRWHEAISMTAGDTSDDGFPLEAQRCPFCERRGHPILAQLVRGHRLVERATCDECGASWESTTSRNRAESL